MAFFTLLWLPSLDTFLHFDHASALNEKRRSAQMPQFKPGLSGLKPEIAGLEAYFNDHFGCRNQLIRWHNELQLALSSGRSDVMLGQDGWLYFDENHMDMVGNYQGIVQFSPEELLQLKNIQQARRDWLAQRGIQYLYVIAPDKQSIYPEYLPSWLKPVRHHTKFDQFVEYMRANSSVTVLDLRPALRDARQISPTYYKTDSHWNSFGGFVASQEILKCLPPNFSQSGLTSLDSFELKKEKFTGGDLTILLGGVYAEEDTFVLATQTQFAALGENSRKLGFYRLNLLHHQFHGGRNLHCIQGFIWPRADALLGISLQNRWLFLGARRFRHEYRTNLKARCGYQ